MTKEQAKIVLDWDGTVTDISSRAETYIDPFLELAAHEIGFKAGELKELMKMANRVVLEKPEKYSWKWKGIPTSVPTDTFLITQASFRLVLEQLSKEPGSGYTPATDALIVKLHEHGRSMMDLVVQPGIGEFIDNLKTHDSVVVVTNSGTQAVEKELNQLLGSEHGVNVHGDAKKFVIDPRWKNLKHFTTQPYPYPRPVSLQRPHYFDVLTDLKTVKLIIGDMSELDLFLPQAMGIPTALKRSPTTPYWEVEYYNQKPQSGLNRFLIGDYSRAIEVLGEVLKR